MQKTYIEDKAPKRFVGSVSIGGLKCHIKPDYDIPRGNRQYFVATLQHKEDVFATRVVEMGKEDFLTFDEKFNFTSLDDDFKIHVQLFCMNLRKNLPFTKWMKKLKEIYVSLPSSERASRKLRYMDVETKSILEENVSCSAFKALADWEVSLENFKKDNRIRLEYSPDACPVDFVILRTTTLDAVKFHDVLRGYLSLGTSKRCKSWEALWCVLEDGVLKFYPNQKGEGLEPLHAVDLRYSYKTRISRASETVSSKPFSIHLPVLNGEVLKRQNRVKVEDYVVNLHTEVQFERWLKEIQFVVGVLKEWQQLMVFKLNMAVKLSADV